MQVKVWTICRSSSQGRAHRGLRLRRAARLCCAGGACHLAEVEREGLDQDEEIINSAHLVPAPRRGVQTRRKKTRRAKEDVRVLKGGVGETWKQSKPFSCTLLLLSLPFLLLGGVGSWGWGGHRGWLSALVELL